MDYDDFPRDFIDDIRYVCEILNPDGKCKSRDALEQLAVEIIRGPKPEYCPRHPYEPDDFPAVMLPDDKYGWTDGDTLRHELYHALADYANHLAEVLRHHSYAKRAAQPTLERMAWIIGLFWRMPQRLVDEVINEYGVTGDTAVMLTDMFPVTLEQAMVRLVFNNPRARVAGFVASGGLIVSTATCNLPVQLTRYQPMPKPTDDDVVFSISDTRRTQAGIILA